MILPIIGYAVIIIFLVICTLVWFVWVCNNVGIYNIAAVPNATKDRRIIIFTVFGILAFVWYLTFGNAPFTISFDNNTQVTEIVKE